MSNSDIELKLDELLSELTWSGSNELDYAGREALKAWLQEFFGVVRLEKNVKDYLESDMGVRVERINVPQAVSKCLGDSVMMVNDYYGAFYMIFTGLRLSAEEAAASGRKILWKDLRSQLKELGIKEFQDVRLPIRKEHAAGADSHDIIGKIPLLEALAQDIKSSGVPLPKLVGVIEVLLGEVGQERPPEGASWVYVWDSAHARRAGVGDAGLALSAAFQEVIALLMRGESSLEMRGQLLTCLKLLFDDESFMSSEKEAVFSFDGSAGEVRQAPGKDAVNTFLMSFGMAQSDKERYFMPDQQFLKEQFDGFSAMAGAPPISLILEAATFVNSVSAENFGSTGIDPEGTSLKTLLMLALFTPRPARQGLVNVIDELAGF